MAARAKISSTYNIVTALSARFCSKLASSNESPASAKAKRTASAEYKSHGLVEHQEVARRLRHLGPIE